MSVNDCFTRYGYIYEFVTLYDLDELIVPRSFNQTNEIFKCNDNKEKLCQQNPFNTPMYDYLKLLIKNDFQHDITRLRSIEFEHAIFFIPNEIEYNLMKQLEDVSKLIEMKGINLKFPIRLRIESKFLFFFQTNYVFIVNENDSEYVIKMNRAYQMIKCLNKNIKKVHKGFLRYLYLLTPSYQRFPKSIHYTRNVNALFTHHALNYTKDSIILTATAQNGHINSHFRGDLSGFYKHNLEVSIKNLVIDYEYFAYLLKYFSNYCH